MVEKKHLRWFRHGAATFRAIAQERGFEDKIPTAEDWYLCPVCIDFIATIEEFDTKELSIEDVPPESVGGRPLVLTCKKKCNNNFGSKFDSQAHKQEEMRQFLSGQSADSWPAEMSVGDFSTRGELHIQGSSGFLFIGVPKQNHPVAVHRMEEHMRTTSEAGQVAAAWEFELTKTPIPARAHVSWIRSAYLAAFATFGWRYILQPALSPIRQQFTRPDDVLLPPLYSFNPDDSLGEREIWVVEEPAPCRSLLVIWGQHSVFLPVVDDPRSLEQLSRNLGGYSDQPVRHRFRGTRFPWPIGPMHLLDPDPRTESPERNTVAG